MKTIHKILVPVGNFFFRWRDTAFTLVFLSAFFLVRLPEMSVGDFRFEIGITVAGFLVALLGQIIRAVTIGYAYIKRGGMNKEIFADRLVIRGVFAHCRNPLYTGNILIVIGSILVLNILWFHLIVLPLFYIIYIAITLAEENYLRGKFGEEYMKYMESVNRFIPGNLRQWKFSIEGMEFTWRRLIKKEHNTMVIVFGGLTLYTILKFHYRYGLEFTSRPATWLWSVLAGLLAFNVIAVILKKTSRLEWDPNRP